MLPFTLACLLIGIAQGAVDAFDARIRTRGVPFTGQSMIDLTTIQTRLAETAVEVECTRRRLMRYDLAKLIDRARRGDTLSMLDRARFRRDHAYIAKLSVQAVSRVFEVSGGMAFTTTSLCWSASAGPSSGERARGPALRGQPPASGCLSVSHAARYTARHGVGSYAEPFTIEWPCP